jgi:hypothetical protein
LHEEARLRAGHDGTYEVAATFTGVRQCEDQQAGCAKNPSLAPESSLLQHEIQGPLLRALEQETDSQRRHSLKNAAVLINQLAAELQAYRDAAEYDFRRPKDLQFRGWNMAKLQSALKKTEARRTSRAASQA